MYDIFSYRLSQHNVYDELEKININKNVREHIFAYNSEERRILSAAGAVLAYSALKDRGELFYLDNGKPCFDAQGVYLSITHCDDYVFCAVSNSEIGIDAESVDRFSEKVIDRLPVVEKNLISDGILPFNKVWTAKEAYCKVSGEPLCQVLKKQLFGDDGEAHFDGFVFSYITLDGYIICVCEKIKTNY